VENGRKIKAFCAALTVEKAVEYLRGSRGYRVEDAAEKPVAGEPDPAV
jgi:hypothetical protein